MRNGGGGLPGGSEKVKGQVVLPCEKEQTSLVKRKASPEDLWDRSIWHETK